MATTDVKARRRARVIGIAEALPEVEVRDGQHVAFSVRRKRFAYYVDDHHGDGRVALQAKAAPGVQGLLVEDAPERFHVPAYVGAHGWVGL